MDDGDLRDQIARLEAEIEELAKSLESCRKAMILSSVSRKARPSSPKSLSLNGDIVG
jgi:cell division septum initiation protein DivIVA